MPAPMTQVFTAGFNSNAATITVVAAPLNGQAIMLRGLCLLVNGATVLTFNSQMSGFGFGPFNFAAALTNPMVLPDLMQTEEADPVYTGFAVNTAFVIANSLSVFVSGYARYSLV